MSCKGLLICLLVCFIPAGCSFLDPKPDPSRFFALASLPRTGQRAQDAAGTNALALGIGPIKFPGYLDRQQFVTRISQNRFAVAENDRWAEPLEENFSRVLSQNLSILLQTDRMSLTHGKEANSPRIKCRWKCSVLSSMRSKSSSCGPVGVSWTAQKRPSA